MKTKDNNKLDGKLSIKKNSVKNTEEDIFALVPMWITYMNEIGHRSTEDEMKDNLVKRINVSMRLEQIHFEIISYEDQIAGFIFYSIDGGIKNVIPAGYGYIMEIYIKPEFRRKGIAKQVAADVCKFYKESGCSKVYLTPFMKNVGFWEKQGFEDSALVDPDNHVHIYIRDL